MSTGEMPREEMLVHLQNNKTVLVSPKFSVEDGQYVETAPGKHITHHSELPSPLQLAVGDPAKLAEAKSAARARAEAANKEVAAIEKAEADAAKKAKPENDPKTGK